MGRRETIPHSGGAEPDQRSGAGVILEVGVPYGGVGLEGERGMCGRGLNGGGGGDPDILMPHNLVIHC